MKRFAYSPRWVVVSLLIAFDIAGAQAAEQAAPTKSLQQAAAQGDIEQLNLHIARGTNLNQADNSNLTPLARAIQSGRVEAVKVLVGGGADVNAPSLFGPPVVQAAERMQKEVLEFLLGNGGDANTRGRSGQTALIAAATLGQQDMVELLVAKGADVNAENDQGQTALTVARRFPDVADFLRKKGAVEPRSAFGDDPYGDRGMGLGGQDYRTIERQVEVLADPNALRAKIDAVPGLSQGIAAVDANGATEERSWASRRGDNRTALLRAAGKQFAGELAFLKGVAIAEKAEKTVSAIDELSTKRKEREEVVARELREARRLALEEARGTAGRGRGRTATRGARGRAAGQAYGDAPGMGYGGAYGGMEPGQMAGRPRGTEGLEEPPLDADTEAQVDAWLGANPEDKRGLLARVHDQDLYELDGLHVVAEEEKATRTVTAIEGIMLARQSRVDRINAKMAEEDARLEQLAERTGAAPGMVRGRRGRGAVQPAQPQGQLPTSARRRRGR